MKTHLIFGILKCIFYTELVFKNNTCIGEVVNKIQKGENT